MNSRRWRSAFAFAVTLAASGCSSPPPPQSDSGFDARADAPPDVSPVDAGSDVAMADVTDVAVADVVADGSAPIEVTFTYSPQWTGATAVSVFGGFGQSDDWMIPFVTLTASGGTFTGSATLPAGDYPYLFQVTGDAAAAMPLTYKRYVIDPTAPDYVMCPSASPTSGEPTNPCGVLHVPAHTMAAPAYHVRGNALSDGHPAAGWLAVIEREEAGSHHFFANRMTTGADGTFDLMVTAGSWRIQLQHPTYMSQNDADLDPVTLATARRVISESMAIASDTNFGSAETGYHDYGALTPTGTTTLPVQLSWTVIASAQTARVAVYGAGTNIGDPWYASPYATATTLSWNGMFNTAMAHDPAVMTGVHYWWGTWQALPQVGSGAMWKLESLVVPITFM